ncbi:MAG: 1-deoxy-D-xylulose-5-phosphate reductoisomerase [Phycisphaerales bacterium]
MPSQQPEHQRSRSTTRRIIVLGCTGSIGTSTLEVLAHLRSTGHAFDIIGLACGSNVDKALEQAQQCHAGALAVTHAESDAIKHATSKGSSNTPRIFTGPNAVIEMLEMVAQPGDLVVAAIVGAAGLAPVVRAIELGCDIALANKETLVAGGDIVLPLVERKGVHLLPVDSEHSAVFQCMMAKRGPSEVERVVLTASGGPFRQWPLERIQNATVAEALNHPTWTMGRKVTVDSATLMNKALEIIEARWLFDLPAAKISAVIHPQSIVHSFVEFIDGSVMAQLNPPDMKGPIHYALTWPERASSCAPKLDWSRLSQLTFEPVDHDRFGAVNLGLQVAAAGGSTGAVFNAANEVAVNAFLAGDIPFGRITSLVAQVLDEHDRFDILTLDDVFSADHIGRVRATEALHAPRAQLRSASVRG